MLKILFVVFLSILFMDIKPENCEWSCEENRIVCKIWFIERVETILLFLHEKKILTLLAVYLIQRSNVWKHMFLHVVPWPPAPPPEPAPDSTGQHHANTHHQA